MHVNSNPISLIPFPKKIERQSGEFTISPETKIITDSANQQNATYLQNLIAPPSGFPLPIQENPVGRANIIQLQIGRHLDIGQEGYTLTVSPHAVDIIAPEIAGVFYGIQTLRQLLPVEIERRTFVPNKVWQLPCVAIEDAPRFAWRGYMLDEGRHFHGKETVQRTLDLMALQKLNVLHWHLTEDQGWRIEIKQYPRLAKIGSKRKGTAKRLFGRPDNVSHGGCYTQEEIKEIVAYAVDRQITIVPEIEMPGHAVAALAAYPELSCTGGPFEVRGRFGISKDIFCAGKESVFTFFQAVLNEVIALFPSPFIHIGGDEAPKIRWKKCPDCQERIKLEGLKDVHALQTYFINRIVAYLAEHGRRAVGWNEILQDALAEDAVVQYWVRNRKGVVAAIQQGRNAILSDFLHTYLDHSYSLTPLSKAYKYEPVFPELSAKDARHVLGIEAPMWTEFAPNLARLDFQTYPRLTAFAETGWSAKGQKNFADFQERLAVFLLRLDELGVAYARGNDVEPPWYKQMFGLFTIAQAQNKTAKMV